VRVKKPKRRLVICADGTWNTSDQDRNHGSNPTNVLHLARAVRPIDARGISQIVFYHQGVGTGMWYVDKAAGGALGAGIDYNIRDLYRFLINNYSPGDEIFLFGFSRGAFTVRSLSGLIQKCGILRSTHAHLEKEAWSIYLNRSIRSFSARASEFRKNNSYAAKIKLLGVWDTVGSLGIPSTAKKQFREVYEFHDLSLGSNVQRAYQALAIDERRGDFVPCLWKSATDGQLMRQVWFAGGHSNVGGGLPQDDLSNIALKWMITRAQESGLSFEKTYLAKLTENHRGQIVDLCGKAPYWLRAKYERVLFDLKKRSTTNEEVHHSVLHRCRDVVDYRPANLEKAIREQRYSKPKRLKPPPSGSVSAAWHY